MKRTLLAIAFGLACSFSAFGQSIDEYHHDKPACCPSNDTFILQEYQSERTSTHDNLTFFGKVEFPHSDEIDVTACSWNNDEIWIDAFEEQHYQASGWDLFLKGSEGQTELTHMMCGIWYGPNNLTVMDC